MDWSILINVCKSNILVSEPSKLSTLDGPVCADLENMQTMGFILALQMLANGVEISNGALWRLRYELVLHLGFENAKMLESDDGKLKIEFGVSGFNVMNSNHQVLLLTLLRSMKRAFDK